MLCRKDSQIFLLQTQNDTMSREKCGMVHQIMCAYSVFDLMLILLGKYPKCILVGQRIIALFLNIPQMLYTKSNWEI